MRALRRFRRLRRDAPQVSDDLRRELDAPTGWMYAWQLTDDLVVPTMHPELPGIHATREALVEPVVREALRDGGRVIDLGAHEGYFSMRALAWGADSVLAVDVRDINTRRAALLREHFGIAPERLQIRTMSVYDVKAADVGTFSVVLVLGLIYHLEDPIGALRVARSLAAPGAPVVVETQLHRGGPVQAGRGVTGEATGEAAFTTEVATWAAKHEPIEEQRGTPLAAFGGVISLIPNRAAVGQAMRVAGLERVSAVTAERSDLNVQYRRRDRGVFVGWAPLATEVATDADPV